MIYWIRQILISQNRSEFTNLIRAKSIFCRNKTFILLNINPKFATKDFLKKKETVKLKQVHSISFYQSSKKCVLCVYKYYKFFFFVSIEVTKTFNDRYSGKFSTCTSLAYNWTDKGVLNDWFIITCYLHFMTQQYLILNILLYCLNLKTFYFLYN